MNVKFYRINADRKVNEVAKNVISKENGIMDVACDVPLCPMIVIRPSTAGYSNSKCLI